MNTFSTRKDRREYFLINTYDVMIIGNQSFLIKKHDNKAIIEYVIAYEDLYDKLNDFHINKTGHGGRVKMEAALKNKFSIPRPAIENFISCCKICNEKKQGRKKVIVRPILSKDFNERGQVDLIDFQSLPDQNYKWILNYQDHSTKFLFLRPLQSKRAEEVARQLLSIFLLIGAPKILQSDNGREFCNHIIEELKSMWPECLIVHGRPRHPQSQGSVERSNQDVEHMIRAWMKDNNSKQWSVGIEFVQWQKNISFHRVIGRSPYKALLGCDPKIGLSSSNIPLSIAEKLRNEDEVLEVLETIDETPEGDDTSAELETVLIQNATILEIDSSEQHNQSVVENSSSAVHEEISESTLFGISNICCCICGKEIEKYELQCSQCRRDFHYICSSIENYDKLCTLCKSNQSILCERENSTSRIKDAAAKMLNTSRKNSPTLDVGDCVLLSVPKVDRGQGDPPNIICIIIDQRNGVNQLGCKNGIIKGWFGSENLSKAGTSFISLDEVNKEKQLSIREAVGLTTGGQGFLKCSCKPGKKQCNSAKCICKKNGVLCNSRCHQSLGCINK